MTACHSSRTAKKMLSARRQLIYWLIGVSSAIAYFVLTQRLWTWRVCTCIETIAAIFFCALIYQICRHSSDSRRQPSSYCSYQLSIVTAAVGTCGRIAEWLYRNYAVDAAEEGSRERAWEVGITHALLTFSLVYYLEFFQKPVSATISPSIYLIFNLLCLTNSLMVR